MKPCLICREPAPLRRIHVGSVMTWPLCDREVRRWELYGVRITALPEGDEAVLGSSPSGTAAAASATPAYGPEQPGQV